MAQVLESDPNLHFALDDQGWHLVDTTTGTVFRWPSDAGRKADVAYIGRLRRPDGKGTFLYLAGIHAPGSTGAAHFIEHHLDELYGEVKTRAFSTLIEADFGDDLTITASRRITPIYRHDSSS